VVGHFLKSKRGGKRKTSSQKKEIRSERKGDPEDRNSKERKVKVKNC